MSTLAKICLTAGTLLCLAVEVCAQPRPAVIELYTSEGCSSCPPAESLLGELAQAPNVLALAFHVDYWDDLGWIDRYALREAVVRQSVYSKTRGQTSVYTPQVIVDGREDYLGSDRRNIHSAIGGVRTGVPIILSVRDENLVVELGGAECLAPSDVLLVTYLRKAVSAIGRGENSGRTLEEFNIVRSMRNICRWSGTAVSFRSPLSAVPPDATDFAVLVQAPGQAQIIGAASHTLL
jgi:hypothetical protein